MSIILQCKESGNYTPHPEGVHSAVCVDVIDLGMVRTEYQGEERIVPKLKLVFETEALLQDGRRCSIGKSFTASLHPKARLAEFIGKWRGRTVIPGESIDLSRLIGASCMLVISHQHNQTGKVFAAIDAVAKPTKKMVPYGDYDPAAARARIVEWAARDAMKRPMTAPAQEARPAAMTRQPAEPKVVVADDDIPF